MTILNDKLLHKKEIVTQGKTEPIPPLLDEVQCNYVVCRHQVQRHIFHPYLYTGIYITQK
jgi:hypothetical protein